MMALRAVRCLIPRFAQTTLKPSALTTIGLPPINRSLYSRKFSTSVRKFKSGVTINFILEDGTKLSAQAKVGDSLLDVVIDNDLDIDGFGACEGTLACSTCHLVFEQSDYDKLPDEPCDEELDMLDLAFALTDTSRLGCQIYVSTDMEGLTVKVPAGVADAREPS